MQRRAKWNIYIPKCVETIDLQPKLEIEREDKSAEETAFVKIKSISGH